MVAEERAFAAFKLTGVTEGSVIINLARPTEPFGVQLALDVPTDADAIAADLVDGLEAMARGDTYAAYGHARQQALTRVLRSVRRIAPEARVIHRAPGQEVRVATIVLEEQWGLVAGVPVDLLLAERVIFGQVQMADVENGRQRIRAKLPNGSDATIPVSDELAAALPGVLGRLAELHVREVLQGDEVIERLVMGFRLLEQEEDGPTRPPKSLEDLAREQGLLMREPPDYPELLQALFPTDEDIDSFEAYLRQRPLIA